MQPFTPHVVIRYGPLADGPRQNIGTGFNLPVGSMRIFGHHTFLPGYKPVNHRAIARAGPVKNGRAVDAVGFKDPPPAPEIPGDWRVRYDHVVGEARAVRKGKAAGALHTRRTGRIIEENTARVQVA